MDLYPLRLALNESSYLKESDGAQVSEVARNPDVTLDALGGAVGSRILHAMPSGTTFMSYGLLTGCFIKVTTTPQASYRRFHLREHLASIAPDGMASAFSGIWLLIAEAEWQDSILLTEKLGARKPLLDISDGDFFTNDWMLIGRRALTDADIVIASKAVLRLGQGQRAVALHDQHHLCKGSSRHNLAQEKTTCCRPCRLLIACVSSFALLRAEHRHGRSRCRRRRITFALSRHWKCARLLAGMNPQLPPEPDIWKSNYRVLTKPEFGTSIAAKKCWRSTTSENRSLRVWIERIPLILVERKASTPPNWMRE